MRAETVKRKGAYAILTVFCLILARVTGGVWLRCTPSPLLENARPLRTHTRIYVCAVSASSCDNNDFAGIRATENKTQGGGGKEEAAKKEQE